MKIDPKITWEICRKNYNFYFYVGNVFVDTGERGECIGTFLDSSRREKSPKYALYFSYSITIGFSIQTDTTSSSSFRKCVQKKNRTQLWTAQKSRQMKVTESAMARLVCASNVLSRTLIDICWFVAEHKRPCDFCDTSIFIQWVTSGFVALHIVMFFNDESNPCDKTVQSLYFGFGDLSHGGRVCGLPDDYGGIRHHWRTLRGKCSGIGGHWRARGARLLGHEELQN